MVMVTKRRICTILLLYYKILPPNVYLLPPTLHPTAFPYYLCFKVKKIHKGANLKKIKQLIKKVNFKYQFVAKENIVL